MRFLLKGVVLFGVLGLIIVHLAYADQHNDDFGEMVFVAAGDFLMGADASFPDEAPAHKVSLDAFWIDKYEVTNAQFARFLNEKGNPYEEGVRWLDIESAGCQIARRANGYQPKVGSEDRPVVEVSWYGARSYAKWCGKRLPTEAEWEKVASWELIAGKKRKWPWGNFWDKNRINCWDSVPQLPMPVNSFPQGVSYFGVHNMAGNVWEWCADWYSLNYYQHSPQKNPTGPTTGEYRVVRGGGWTSYKAFTRTTYRGVNLPTYTSFDTGFRCCK